MKTLGALVVLAALAAGCYDGPELEGKDAPPWTKAPEHGVPPDGGMPAYNPNALPKLTQEQLDRGNGLINPPPPGRPDPSAELRAALLGAAFTINPPRQPCCQWPSCPAAVARVMSGSQGAGQCVQFNTANLRINNLSTSGYQYWGSAEFVNDNVDSFSTFVTQGPFGHHHCISFRVYQGPGSAPVMPYSVGSNNGTGLVVDRWGCSDGQGMGSVIFATYIKSMSGWTGWDGVTAISVDYWQI